MKTPPRTPARRRSRARIVATVGADALTAVVFRPTLWGMRPGRASTHPLTPAEGGSWPSLEAALQEVVEESGERGAALEVALLPPLAQTKVLSLPPVRTRELRPLVMRNVRRYFITADSDPLVVDTLRLRRPRGRRNAPALTVCASETLLRAVAAATAAAGLRLEAVTPAALALTRAVLARLPSARRRTCAVVACGRGWGEIVFLKNGVPQLFLPLFGVESADPASQARTVLATLRGAREMGVEARQMIVCGEAPFFSAVQDLCADESPEIPEVIGVPSLTVLPPAELAAVGMLLLRQQAPALRLDELRLAARRQTQRRSAIVSVATACILAVTAGLHLWSVHRQLDAVRAQRQALAAPVAEVLAARQRIAGVRSLLESVGRLEEGAPRWTVELASLADALPRTAYLESLNGDGNRLRLVGFAASATEVVPALERSPRFSGAALAAPVRHDAALERESFDVTVRLDAIAAPATPARGAP